MTSQKDGVFNAVEAFMSENDRVLGDDKVILSTDDRASVVDMLVAATEAGELERKSNKTGSNHKEYWQGTLSNWLRKDPRLNGNVKYEAKNPGSRAGAGDGKLKNLKMLLKQVELTKCDESIVKVTEAIASRELELANERAKKLEVNADLIPEELQHLIPTD